MADTKTTDLAVITGDAVASTDDFLMVDISDTTMAASGTDKKMTAIETANAMQFFGHPLTPSASFVVLANRSALAVQRYEIANGQSLEIASGGFFEIT